MVLSPELGFKSLLALVLLAQCAVLLGDDGKSKPPTTVAAVDLARYAGTWYEIAKIPNRFQRACDRDTTATYTVRDDGRLTVINRCIERDGTPKEARGVARVVDGRTCARLKVSFVRFLGLQLFWGDYWIIGLAPDYRYAVVGTPTRKYGWILSRTPAMAPADLATVHQLLQRNGYNPDDFQMTRQTAAGTDPSPQ